MIRAVKEVVDQQAYDVESYDICFYGTCEECKKKEGEKQNEEVCM